MLPAPPPESTSAPLVHVSDAFLLTLHGQEPFSKTVTQQSIVSVNELTTGTDPSGLYENPVGPEKGGNSNGARESMCVGGKKKNIYRKPKR